MELLKFNFSYAGLVPNDLILLNLKSYIIKRYVCAVVLYWKKNNLLDYAVVVVAN